MSRSQLEVELKMHVKELYLKHKRKDEVDYETEDEKHKNLQITKMSTNDQQQFGKSKTLGAINIDSGDSIQDTFEYPRSKKVDIKNNHSQIDMISSQLRSRKRIFSDHKFKRSRTH